MNFEQRSPIAMVNNEHLLALVREKRWDELEIRIKENESDGFHLCECYGSHRLLHLVCSYQPPLYIVEYLVAKSPDSCLQTDCNGRLPFHIAISNRACRRVVMFLLRQHKAAAKTSTTEGKYPLHLLFESFSDDSTSSEQDVINTRQNMKDADLIFRSICNVAPETVVIEDEEGINPIEYAIDNEVDMSIIKRMGSIAQKVNKAREGIPRAA